MTALPYPQALRELPELLKLHQKFGSGELQPVDELLERARTAVPNFSEYVESFVR